jgi:hypothetical protein
MSRLVALPKKDQKDKEHRFNVFSNCFVLQVATRSRAGEICACTSRAARVLVFEKKKNTLHVKSHLPFGGLRQAHVKKQENRRNTYAWNRETYVR